MQPTGLDLALTEVPCKIVQLQHGWNVHNINKVVFIKEKNQPKVTIFLRNRLQNTVNFVHWSYNQISKTLLCTNKISVSMHCNHGRLLIGYGSRDGLWHSKLHTQNYFTPTAGILHMLCTAVHNANINGGAHLHSSVTDCQVGGSVQLYKYLLVFGELQLEKPQQLVCK